MPLPITCACGARFEADDALAGREARCPECQEPVAVPAADRAPPVTSLLALASATLALVGAFTVVGTALAAVLGLAGLVSISRNRDRLAGTGLATFGLVAGVALTALTLFALGSGELFGLGSFSRLGQFGDEVDFSGPLEVSVADKGFAITRPSAKWGRARHGAVDDPVADQLSDRPDLLLVQPARYLFVEAREADRGLSLDRCRDEVVTALVTGHNDVPGLPLRNVRPTVRETKELPADGWAQRREFVVDIRYGSQPWTMLVRLQKKADGTVYITRGYTQRRHFARAEEELRRALDSFRALGGK
jgi:hypothetical protein